MREYGREMVRNICDAEYRRIWERRKCIMFNAGSIPATSTMEINKYIKTEMAKLDRGIVATPTEDYLNDFAEANGGSNDFLLMQLAKNYGYKLALLNIENEIAVLNAE